MVKDDQGPSLPSLLKSDLGTDFLCFVLVAHQFVLGVMPTAVAIELTTLGSSKARTQMIIFTFVAFRAVKQLGEGCCGQKQEAATNQKGILVLGSQTRVVA